MTQTVLAYLKGNYFMIPYVIVFVLSLKKYPLYFNSSLKYLPIIFAYTFLSELLGFFILNFESIQIVGIKELSFANNLIFNIYDLIYFNYFYFIFWRTLRVKFYKEIITMGVASYLITSLINPFFENFLVFPQTFAYAVGSLVLLLCIFLYYREIRQNLQNENELLAWLSIGHFIFYCSFPIILFMGIYHSEIYEELNLRQLHHLLIAAMYTCFIIGFIKLKYPILKR